jgi:pSer/pThr/pTyr-binding forkhead associated (FHA) protein
VVEFADTFMSSGHAVLSRPQGGRRDEAFEIRDRESAPSANGTFVNSRRLVPGEVMRLGDGDVVKVGATELVFRSLWLPGGGARPS